MFFGLTLEKLVLFGVIAAMIIGPQRLPAAAAALARVVTRLKTFTASGAQRLRDELGPDFDDTDWRTLDPRQYDPRRIIREALIDAAPVVPPASRDSAAPVVTPGAEREPG